MNSFKKLTAFTLALIMIISLLTANLTATAAQTNNNSAIPSGYAFAGVCGDVDLDKAVTVIDAAEIQLYLVEKRTFTLQQSKLSDVDGDDKSTVLDATEIQLWCAEKKTSDSLGQNMYIPHTFDETKYSYINADGRYYLVSNNDVFTCTYAIAVGDKVSCMDATLFYDNVGISFNPAVDEYGDYTYAEFPNIPNITCYYEIEDRIEDKIRFNFATANAVRFPVNADDSMTDKNTVFTSEFKFNGDAGVYEMDFYLKVLSDYYNDRIIFNGELVNPDVYVAEETIISGLIEVCPQNIPAPTQPPTEAPTVAPTAAPTFAPTAAPTDYPTAYPTEGPTDYPGYDYPTVAPEDPWDDPPAYYDNVLHFDADSAGWANYTRIFCHIWEYGQDPFFAWQSKAERCTDTDGDGVWTYDLDEKGITIEPGKYYGVIFCNDNSVYTYDLLFDYTCLGDTAYCKDPYLKYENPVDSNKLNVVAYWRYQEPTEFGPIKQITSIGNVVGECISPYTSAQEMFELFLEDNLYNAQCFSGKTEQCLIDDIGLALGLSKKDVQNAINNTGVRVYWSSSASPLPSSPSNPGGSSGSKVLKLNTSTNITTNTNGVYYSFTPTTSGYYNITSSATSCDPYVDLYLSDILIASNDDRSIDYNFSLTEYMYANTTYTFKISVYNGTQTFPVKVTKQ